MERQNKSEKSQVPSKIDEVESSSRESSVADSKELSPEEIAEIQEHTIRRFKYLGTRWAKAELNFTRSNPHLMSAFPGHEEKEKVIASMLEKLSVDAREARKRFWTKIRIASSAVLVVFATPDKDARSRIHESTGSFSERTLAAEELAENGITNYQKQAYFGALSDSLARGLTPWGYASDYHDVNVGKDLVRGATGFAEGLVGNQNNSWEGGEVGTANMSKKDRDEMQRIDPNRMDAWRLYLGIPQQNRTFGISEFKPSKSKEDRYYYRIQNFLQDIKEWKDALPGPSLKDVSPMKALVTMADPDKTNHDAAALDNRMASAITSLDDPTIKYDYPTGIMGKFTLKKGHDERGDYISYYDRWDLDGSVEGKEGMIGKPFEIYDRIYYDPKTFEVLDPKAKAAAAHSK